MFSKWQTSCTFLFCLTVLRGIAQGESALPRSPSPYARNGYRRQVFNPEPFRQSKPAPPPPPPFSTTPEPVSVIQQVMTQAQENLHHQGNCRLNKVTLSQGKDYQYIQYVSNFPPIKQFHFCLWIKSNNLSTEHPLFSYAALQNPNMITMWISPEGNQETGFHLVINGVKVYNINYFIPTGKWTHICQSWNGDNGHWGIFVNGNAVGDGYGPSKLIKFEIPGGGRPITGWEQDPIQRSHQGIQGEITLFEMEDVALGVGTKGSASLRPLQSDCLPRHSGNLISWGKTHLKLFGGAEIYGVQPICGSFQE